VQYGDPAPMQVGQDVELVVRRGLAKSNGERFPCVTDFSDALRAAATGRARASQRSALIAYAAGEVASSESKGRTRRRSRGRVMAIGVVASIAIAFVVGKAAHRRWSPFRTLAAAPATVNSLAGNPEPIPPPPALVEARPLPQALDARPVRSERRSLSPHARPRTARPRLSVDEDATMPATRP
jgi:hypothetical protein